MTLLDNIDQMQLQHIDCSRYEKAISFEQLLLAANSCLLNVNWKSSVINWMFEKEKRCAELHYKLENDKYSITPYLYFHLKGPKPRLISSTKFTDRVVLRSLCNNGLYDMIAKPLIYDNGACLNNKGLLFVFNRFKYKLIRYLKINNFGYILKCDVHHFFDDTSHKMIKEYIRKYISDENFFKHVCMIIDSFKDRRPKNIIDNDKFGERGIGLGSQISQLLMLLYLNDLDHCIYQKFKNNTYVRYMDDMIMICKSENEAKIILQFIKQKIETLGLKLNSKTQIINMLKYPFEFLKVSFKVKNKHIFIHMSRKTISREVNKLKKMFHKNIDTNIIYDQYNSWFGSNKYKMSKGLMKYLNKKFKEFYENYISKKV